MKDEGNGIIVKLVDNDEFAVGDVLSAVPKLNKLHFFDAETEVTLIRNIPEHNTVVSPVADGKLDIFGSNIALPPVLAAAAANEKSVELTIPPQAIVRGEDFKLKVSKIEETEGKKLAYLINGDRYLFALVDDSVKEGEDYGFSQLYEKVGVKAGEQVLARTCHFPGGRDEVRHAATRRALEMLKEKLS